MVEYVQCGYTHDLSDDEIFDHMNADEWSCQHPADDESEYCPFHQPVGEKDDQVVVERFREVVNTGYDDIEMLSQERFRFIGAEFGDFSLPLFTTLATGGEFEPAAAEYPIDLRDIRVEDGLHWSKTRVRHDLLFDGVFVGGEVDFSEATIEGECSFVDGQFASLVLFDKVEIADELRFDRSEFGLAVSMAGCEIDGTVSFESSHISILDEVDERLEEEVMDPGDVYCRGSHFGGVADFKTVVLEGDAWFEAATIEDSAWFDEAIIKGGAYFKGASIDGNAKFEGVSIEYHTVFEAATIEGNAWFKRASIEGGVLFEAASIESSVVFDEASIESNVVIDEASVKDNAQFEAASIEGRADFDEVTIGGLAWFEGATINDSIWFEGATINDSIWFEEVTIKGEANFDEATIEGSANFDEATIKGNAWFNRASIKGNAWFKAAIIDDNAWFEAAIIESSVVFDEATIGGRAEFEGASIEDNAQFIRATIEGKAWFDEAIIGGIVWFETARIKDDALFDGVSIEGGVKFDKANIEGSVKFDEANIESSVKFDEANTEWDVQLNEATIEGDANFNKVGIGGEARFVEATIKGDANFDEVGLDQGADFKRANIEGDADFDQGDIKGSANFDEATIGVNAYFDEATIEGNAYFKGVSIEGSANFAEATIEDDANFAEATIEDDANFAEATMEGEANFAEATIEGDANFVEATVKRYASFMRSVIKGDAEFRNVEIEDDIWNVRFQNAKIMGDVDFEAASIGGYAYFEAASIEGDAKFNEANIYSATFRESELLGEAHINARFSKAPALDGITVGETLLLGWSLDNDERSVIDVSDATVRSIQVTGDAQTQVIKLDRSTIEQLSYSEVPNEDTFKKWSFREMNFEMFDFTENRKVLTTIDYNFHTLASDVRDSLAIDAVDEEAQEDTEMLVDILVGIPTISRNIADDEIRPSNLGEILSLAAKTVFTDDSLESSLAAGEAEKSEVTAAQSIRDGWRDDQWIYGQDTAKAVHRLSKIITTEGALVDAVATEAVSTHLKDIASTVSDADPDVGPDVEGAPSTQVNTDQLPKDDLQTALAETYADPDKFCAANNPEVWEATYLNGKTAASNQGLNKVAAEFFLREKRFKRRRHAQQVREGNSLFERAKAAFDWISNLTMDITTGYGERPRNVIISSLVVVGLFTGVYRLLDALPGSSSWLEHLLFSLQSFVAFIIGTRPQGTLLVRYASAIEAFLGAFFVALFIFTLTRSLNR